KLDRPADSRCPPTAAQQNQSDRTSTGSIHGLRLSDTELIADKIDAALGAEDTSDALERRLAGGTVTSNIRRSSTSSRKDYMP
ncbi:hypothetical protein, partial [Mycolicibacterium chlorophenolicum]|uniref:hypothetical protein n=1 Tax=Mycolicibacterium chlorophenolicum TaxID=37916 RepID=UPI001F2B0E0B